MPPRFTALLAALGAFALGVVVIELRQSTWAIIVGSVALSAPLAEQSVRQLDAGRPR